MDNQQTVVTNNDSQEVGSGGMTFSQIWFIINKHIVAILVFLVIGAAGGFAYDRFQPVTYQTSATLMGNKGQTSSASGGSYQDYYLADYISQTLVDFVTQYRVFEDTVEYICNDTNDPVSPGLGYGEGYITVAQLQSGISATSASLFVTVTFKLAVKNTTEAKWGQDENKVLHYHMIVLDALCQTIVNIANETKLNDKGEEVARYPFFNGNIDIMSPAKNTQSVSNTMTRILAGFGIGAVVALLYVVARELLDNRFKDAEDVEKTLGLPVLASIPEYTLENFPKVNKFDPREVNNNNNAISDKKEESEEK